MENVTEINLDNISTSNVQIDKLESENQFDLSENSTKDNVEDLDMLVAPEKSRIHSPAPVKINENENVKLEKDYPPSSTTKAVEDSGERKEFDLKFDINRNKKPNVNSSAFKPVINKSYTPPVSSSIYQMNSSQKQELLFKLKRLESRGIPLSRDYNSSSSLEDMQDEYSRLKNQRDLENSIKFQRKTMMALSSGVEFINSKFDPFDIKLDGWSESLHENLTDYDDVFEELHEKYKSKAKIAPELKLLMMMGGSAVMFHMTNSIFKSASPDMGDILRNNPDLAKQFASAAVNEHTKNSPGLGNVMEDMLNSQNQQRPTFIPPQPSFIPEENNIEQTMNGPKDQDVERILNQIKEFKEEPSTSSTKEINIQSEPTIKKRRGRPPKNSNKDTSYSLNI